jgi:hypothetical protein
MNKDQESMLECLWMHLPHSGDDRVETGAGMKTREGLFNLCQSIVEAGKPPHRIVIESIVVNREDDNCPCLDWLGKWSNENVEGAIDRQETGHWKHGEYRYFVPAVAKGQINYDSTLSDEEREKYANQDHERMESLEDGKWYMLGVQAVCRLKISYDGGKNWHLQDIHSGGLWGIESDSEESYIKEQEDEQLDELKRLVVTLGVPQEVADEEFKHHYNDKQECPCGDFDCRSHGCQFGTD